MKNLIVLGLFASILALGAFAEHMSAGVGYQMGVSQTDSQTVTDLGAFFQYDFGNFIGLRGNISSLNKNIYLKTEDNNSYSPTGGETVAQSSQESNEENVGGMALGLSLLAQLKNDLGCIYFGPGIYTWSFKGTRDWSSFNKTTVSSGSTSSSASISDTRTGDVSGSVFNLTITFGSKMNFSDRVFGFGEICYHNNIQSDKTFSYNGSYHSEDYDGTSSSHSYSGKDIITSSESLLTIGFGVGMNL